MTLRASAPANCSKLSTSYLKATHNAAAAAAGQQQKGQLTPTHQAMCCSIMQVTTWPGTLAPAENKQVL
jgi:hypothetical protein